jgi:hypothetical protein
VSTPHSPLLYAILLLASLSTVATTPAVNNTVRGNRPAELATTLGLSAPATDTNRRGDHPYECPPTLTGFVSSGSPTYPHINHVSSLRESPKRNACLRVAIFGPKSITGSGYLPRPATKVIFDSDFLCERIKETI